MSTHSAWTVATARRPWARLTVYYTVSRAHGRRAVATVQAHDIVMEVSQGSGVCAALCIRRTLYRHVTTGTPMVIFLLFDCLLTVFDEWYTQNHGCSLQIVTGLPRLYKQCTNGEPIVKNSQNTVKTAQKWPLVYQSSHVYQDCINRVPMQCTKNSHKTDKTAKKWPLVYQSSQVYQHCTNSVTIIY